MPAVKSNRPIDLPLSQVISVNRSPIAIASILHRISGIILFLLIPLSLMLVFAIIYAIWWAVDRGQFDDLEKYSDVILLDDDSVHPEQK